MSVKNLIWFPLVESSLMKFGDHNSCPKFLWTARFMVEGGVRVSSQNTLFRLPKGAKSAPPMRILLLISIIFVLWGSSLQAALVVNADEGKQTGNKVVIKLTMTNTFSKTIEKARAQTFLLDNQNKVIGQATHWIIEGTKSKRGLAPRATATYYFVISTEKPFTSKKITCSRIVLEGGEFANPQRDFELVQ